jgi:hypothetical protein
MTITTSKQLWKDPTPHIWMLAPGDVGGPPAATKYPADTEWLANNEVGWYFDDPFEGMNGPFPTFAACWSAFKRFCEEGL